MNKNIVLSFVLALFTFQLIAQSFTPQSLPNSILTGKQGRNHVQGVAVDQAKGFVYFSFTDKLIKMDTAGNLLGSVVGIVGHLGDMHFDAASGKLYASLEYKQDAIGKGVAKNLGVEALNEVGFYVAIFDLDRIDRMNMSAENDGVLHTVYLKEVVDDFLAEVKVGKRTYEHRFACSGMDGITIAPPMGAPNSDLRYLYVAYGVYGDVTRNDNDNQVILQYDLSKFEGYAQTLYQGKLHQSGPAKPMEKYFVRTGNTNWGIQNMAYDPTTGNLFAAVYKGKKPEFPNYRLFVIDAHKKPGTAKIVSNNKKIKVKTLSLLQEGLYDKSSDIYGWNFKWGSTGLVPLGEGLFYISHNKKDKEDGQQSCDLFKYKWIGKGSKAFEMVK